MLTINDEAELHVQKILYFYTVIVFCYDGAVIRGKMYKLG